jgi:hypothetical protein
MKKLFFVMLINVVFAGFVAVPIFAQDAQDSEGGFYYVKV